MAKKTEEKKVIAGRATNIMFCGCESSFQDKEFGKNKRAHNKSFNGWVCTVCNNLKKG